MKKPMEWIETGIMSPGWGQTHGDGDMLQSRYNKQEVRALAESGPGG